MAKKIRVHTLMLPYQDAIASYILSNPEYTITVQNLTPLPKIGACMMHLQYEDTSSGDEDEVLNLIQRNKENWDKEHPNSEDE